MKNFKVHLIGAILVLFTASFVLGQSVKFVPGDQNFTKTLAFHKPDTILVVSPDNYTLTHDDKADIERYVFWEKWQKKPVYAYKTESEIIAGDMKMHLQCYGPFNLFKNPDFLKIPFKQCENGFAFNNQEFIQPEDAFYYINDDANRMYTCKNSENGFNQYINYGAGFYQLHVFRNCDLVLTGFSSDKEKKEAINDIDSIRAQYFRPFRTKYFDFEIAADLDKDSLEIKTFQRMDDFIDSVCIFLAVDISKLERITTYIYADKNDLQTFIASPPGQTVYGKSIGHINHLSSFDLQTFRHETTHTIVGKTIGLNTSNFFVEGIAVCNEYFFYPKVYQNDIKTAKANPEVLTPELIKSSNAFYNDMVNYPIAGAFTRFLIDKIGITAFKKAYAENQIEECLKIKTGKDWPQLIAEFHNQ